MRKDVASGVNGSQVGDSVRQGRVQVFLRAWWEARYVFSIGRSVPETGDLGAGAEGRWLAKQRMEKQ